jgi:molecular chaperone GrpE
MSKEGKYKSRQPIDPDDLEELDNPSPADAATAHKASAIPTVATPTAAAPAAATASAEEAPTLGHPSYDELTAKCTAAEIKRDENWEQVLRLQAEIHNLHKRHERDITHAHRFGIEKFIKELIPVVDSLEHSLAATTEGQESVKAIREGVEMTLNLFYKALEKYGVKFIDPTGEPFNPEFHEAMTAQEHPEVAPNTVLMVLQRGYVLHERLLRPARVIVSKSK